MAASTTYDPAGEATQLAYPNAASGGTTGASSGYASALMNFSQGYNPFGQVATASSSESSQVYSYDGAGRLVSVGDNFEGARTTRSHTLDANSNRTAFTAAASTPVGGACPTTTTMGSTPSSTAYFEAITQGNALDVTLASSGSSCLDITTAISR